MFRWLLARMPTCGLHPCRPAARLDDLVALVASGVLRLADLASRAGAERPPQLNVMISDGRHLVAARWGKSLHWTERRGLSDCAVCRGTPGAGDYRAVVVASEPATDEPWHEVPEGTFLPSTKTWRSASTTSSSRHGAPPPGDAASPTEGVGWRRSAAELGMTERHSHDHVWPGEYTYCPHCAAALEPAQLGRRTRMRCPQCGFVHWRNPAVGAAVVVFDDQERVLMVLRAEGATRPGFWSIPAGYVDYGEEIRSAAARELREETGLNAEIGDVVWVASNFHDPEKLTVGIWFAGTVVGGELQPGDDAEDARFFALDDLPPLAFETDAAYLRTLGAAAWRA